MPNSVTIFEGYKRPKKHHRPGKSFRALAKQIASACSREKKPGTKAWGLCVKQKWAKFRK